MDNDNLTVWELERYFEVLLPCPLARVAGRLPAGIQALEPAPGRALLSIGCLRFHPGNLGELPAFDELTVALSIVSPDPERTSDFDFLTVTITSPNARFLELAAELDKMPITTCPGLRFTWDDAPARVRVADEDGPIVELAFHQAESPSALDLHAHSLQVRDDGQWLSRARWTGEGTLAPLPDCSVRVHPHRFWNDLPLDALDLQPMMALVAAPGPHRFGFYPPRRWP